MSRPRGAIALTLAVLACALPATAHAAPGTYEVVFCSADNPVMGGEFTSTNAFLTRDRCADSDNDNAVKIESVDRAAEGRFASARWTVEEPLGIVGVDAMTKLRRADGYRASLAMTTKQRQVTSLVADGTTGSMQFEPVRWTGAAQPRFEASLECSKAPSCSASPVAKTWLRDLTFTVEDSADPEVTVSGSLFSGGWIRGEARVGVDVADSGSGVWSLDLTANENVLEIAEGACPEALRSGKSTAFVPCEGGLLRSWPIDTAGSSFVDGTNEIRVCARDFSMNALCHTRLVKVDNSAPDLGFASHQDPNDPEHLTVRVDEPHSGLRTGLISYRPAGGTEWQPLLTQKTAGGLAARVDSAAEEPGTYEFMVSAEDVAGNEAETTLREDGTPMTLEFPLRSGVQLDGSVRPGGARRTVLRYGKDALAKGRLLDAEGQPLAGKEVVIDEYFGEGALIDHRVRTVVTDKDGRWSSGLPAGPSRAVSATYAGDQRYLDDQVQVGRLAVKSRARFGLDGRKIKEGRAITFLGKVGSRGAHIPTRGKLLQLQYLNPANRQWNTVRNPFRTKSDGRYRFRYRFGKHYATDVKIRFRLKVPYERGWPYQPVQSRSRRVIVKAK